MEALLLTFCAALFAAHTTGVDSITNQEFLEHVKPYAEDIKFVDEHDVVDDVIDDAMGVVELPGNPGDELDVGYLLQVLQQDLTTSLSGNPCSCSGDQCNCCVKKTFKATVVFKKVKFTLNACVKVTYLRSNRGFKVEIKYNNRRVYNREISLRNPPALCFGVPGVRGFARVCVQFYNVNLSAKSMCVRLVGVLDLKIKKFQVRLNMACFRIKGADNDMIRAFQEMTDAALVGENFQTQSDEIISDESKGLEYEPLENTDY